MSAVNIIREGPCIHVMTDGAAWGPDGRLVQPYSKVAVFPAMPGVIAVRGDPRILPVIAMHVGLHSWSFDELLSNAVETVRQARETCRHDARTEIMLVGYSRERGDLEHWLLPWHDDYVPHGGPAAGELARRDGDALYAAPPAEGTGFTLGAKFDPYTDGVALMEAQRRIVHQVVPGVRAAGLGVYIQLTTVTARGVDSRIIHRWPEDKPGDLIALPGLVPLVVGDDELVDDNGDLILV